MKALRAFDPWDLLRTNNQTKQYVTDQVGRARGAPIRARKRSGGAYDNGLSKVIAIYAAQGGLTTK
jgi:hypothetical protein